MNIDYHCGAIFIDLRQACNSENDYVKMEKEKTIFQELLKIGNYFHSGLQVHLSLLKRE